MDQAWQVSTRVACHDGGVPEQVGEDEPGGPGPPRAGLSAPPAPPHAAVDTEPNPSLPHRPRPRRCAAGTSPRSAVRSAGRSTTVVLFFVFEYLLLPEIASARKSLKLLGQVNVAWLSSAVAPRDAAPCSPTPSSPARSCPPTPPAGSGCFRINMSSLAVSHVLPGGTAPGTAVGYRLLTESGRAGQHGRVRSGHPGGRLGRGPERHLLAGPAHLDPPRRLQPPLRVRRHRRRDPPRPPSPGRCSCSPGASTAPPTGSGGSLARVPVRQPRPVLTGVLQKVADRLEILLRDRRLLRARHALGGRQLAPRRRLALGVPAAPSATTVFPDRPARRLRPGQHPGRHPDHPRRPRAWSRAC